MPSLYQLEMTGHFPLGVDSVSPPKLMLNYHCHRTVLGSETFTGEQIMRATLVFWLNSCHLGGKYLSGENAFIKMIEL